MTADVAVVGGGIAGLAAAHRLRALLGPGARIVVLEQSDRVGGKLRTVDIAGTRFDVGAEAWLNRRPEVADLVAELGLGGVVHPTGARSTVRAGATTRPIPGGTMLGLPADPAAVADVLSADGLRRVEAEAGLRPLRLDGDAPLGPLLRERYGDELTDRLVDPLLGGVYAGSVDGLGLRATMAPIAAALDAGATSLTEAAARVVRPATGEPVFATLETGLSGLVRGLAAAADVRTGTVVRELERSGAGWRLALGAAAPGHALPDLRADAVVLAVPAPSARKLLAGVVPEASAAYARVQLASMAVVALAFPEGTELPGTSGVLVGAGERRADGAPFAVKAFTYSATKWGRGGPVLVRGSVGRFGDPGALRLTDDELVRVVRADLAELAGVTAGPLDAVVQRWGGGLPQYAVGHTDLVAGIERAVAATPGLAVAGATLHGVGLPACAATGDAAARRVAAHLLAAR
ncbi:protoporphyrinogen oxidase [Actinokineospora fastidiosa]|uniref:Coproporphyrinogen III oxidase n=1 Tax=Actinokineospora fastidiosa TaxID=1816 RepID=A0A918GNZ5_9PSEU|nr:protoporphyrinogen oxidase [Actinokineospora fastidiosa]GGS50442.1 protoporphyrinogen oxidase [Actinokineospora fastidiosa]